MIWTDDLLDPETEEFANRKKEIEEEVIFCEIFTKFNQFVLDHFGAATDCNKS